METGMFAFKLGKLSITTQRPAITMNPAAQRTLVVTPHHHRIELAGNVFFQKPAVQGPERD